MKIIGYIKFNLGDPNCENNSVFFGLKIAQIQEHLELRCYLKTFLVQLPCLGTPFYLSAEVMASALQQCCYQWEPWYPKHKIQNTRKLKQQIKTKKTTQKIKLKNK